MDILSVVTRVPILFFGVERHDDDFADRINYKYTVAVLVIFAIIVTNRQFGTKQIHCWIPAYFTRNYEEYINDICWVSNTYYISLDQKLPEAEQIRKSFELKYYQWVPFILLSQAFFFYIPHIAWRALSRRSGIDIRDIVEAASNYKSVDKYENRQKYMNYMLTAVDQYVDDPRRRKETRRSLFIKRLLSGVCFISGKFLGNYLMVLYLFTKLAFIANCISQLFVLNLLLGHEFHKFGFELLDKIINGKGWDTGSRIFPKISMCDFRIREIGNPKVSHRYTVQCVLPINLFNQQIFTFIWFWYCIVLLVNIYSLCVWTYRFLPTKRLRYISRRIEIMRQALFWRQKNPLNFDLTPELEFHEFEKDLIKHFVHDYLESDGLFILRVLSSNTSDFVCTELIQELWKYYRKQRKFNRTSDEEDDDDEDLNSDNNSLNAHRNDAESIRNRRGDFKPTRNFNQNENFVENKGRQASKNRTRMENPIEKKELEAQEEEEEEEEEEGEEENLDEEEEEDWNEDEELSKKADKTKSRQPTGMNSNSNKSPTQTYQPTEPKVNSKNKPFVSAFSNVVKAKKYPTPSGTSANDRNKLTRTNSHDPRTLSSSSNMYLLNNQNKIPQKQITIKHASGQQTHKHPSPSAQQYQQEHARRQNIDSDQEDMSPRVTSTPLSSAAQSPHSNVVKENEDYKMSNVMHKINKIPEEQENEEIENDIQKTNKSKFYETST